MQARFNGCHIKNRQRFSLGVTLIELMVTLAIAAIMLTLAAPSFQSLIRNTHARTVASDLATTLNLARSEAIKRGWPVTVCKSDDILASSLACSTTASWEDGWLAFVDNDQDGIMDIGDLPIRVGRPATERTSISGGTNYADYVSYFPSGTSKGNGGLTNGSFAICIEGILRKIIINNTGRLRIEPGAC